MAIINGTFLPDILVGTAEDDIINGFGGLDIISGGDGNDIIDGGDGDDVLSGGDGNDILIGGLGSATLLSLYNGGNGNDIMIASSIGVAEDFDGGDGIDTVSFAARISGVTTFLSVLGIPLLDTVRNVENVIGSAFNDILTGDGGNNTLDGSSGNDVLDGSGGNDILIGGLGLDAMHGGTGNDVFHVDNAGDTVSEFDGGGNDRVIASVSYTLAAGISVEAIEAAAGSANINLTGNGQDQDLVGNNGNNFLDGAGGVDTAVFTGVRADYSIVDNGNGTVTFTDTRAAPNDGVDTVTNIEFVRFANGTFAIASLLNGAPVVDLNGGAGGVDHAVTFVENGAGVAIGASIMVSDPDTGDLIESATVTLTDRVDGDSLTIGAVPGGFVANTVSTAGAITITITGPGTVAQYQAMLASILYASSSENPGLGGADLARTITVAVNDGALGSAVATTTVTITPVDDLPVAQPDAFFITESGTIAGGNLFASNGSGADSDPDGVLLVAAVNGSALNVGTQVTLASGALLTVNANGTFDYNPNGAFLPTPTPGSGASNTPAHDSFTYTVAGGNTVTVTIALTGLDTDDLLLGTDGADVMSGGGGNDGLLGGAGNDTLAGDAGNDSLHGEAGIDGLLGGTGDDFLDGGDGNDFLHGQEGEDTLTGGTGNDFLSGGAGADAVYGGTGDDIYIADGLDFIVENAGEGNDLVYAAASYTLSAGQEIEIVSAGDFAGTNAIDLGGNELNNILWGNAAANVLTGNGGDDNMHSFGGNDGLLGGDGNDFVDGGDGDDSLHGGDGNDTLIGAAGNDFLSGGAGIDVVYGGAGNDTFVVDAGDYVVEAAGGGTDIVYATASFALSVGQEVETLAAGDAMGTLAINLGGNELANTLIGNGAANVLTGGGGNDVFAFTSALGAGNVDTLTDFGAGDRIALDDAIFSGIGSPGSFNANAFVAGAAAQDLDDRIVYNSATGQLFYDADGSGAGAAVLFATLQGNPVLTAGDFQVI